MDGVVSVATVRRRICRTFSVRVHKLQADEPLTVGGGDVAPNPYLKEHQALLGALESGQLFWFAD
jgi:hypothetical protein